MAGMQVSGLLTGLDTGALVTNLIAAERQQGNYLTTNKTTATNLATAYTNLNGMVKSMGDAANALVPDSITKQSAWASAKASASDASVVTATTDATAVASTLRFTVDKVAQAGAAITGELPISKRSDVLNGGNAFSLTIAKGADPTAADATQTKISLAGGATINDVAKAVNDSGAGVNATVVQVSEGKYRLQLTSKDTGAASNVTLMDGDTPTVPSTVLGGTNRLYNGSDTQITVGEGANAYQVTSTTTKVSGLMQGVTIEALKASTTPVTLGVTKDVDAIAGKVQAMVDAANKALKSIDDNNNWDASTKKGGVFTGDSATRDLTKQISDVFVGSRANLPSIAGVSIDKSGVITFDKAKFADAYTKDPGKVESTLTDTATKLSTVSKNATNSADGLLTMQIKGQNDLVKDYTRQITAFNDRMDQRETVLKAQYSALDTMLSKLKSQGDWLTGQINSLPKIGS